MSDLPPSSSQRKSAFEGSPDDLLKQGLVALRHQDYEDAVQCLSRLSQDRSVPGTLRLKALIGLVKALHGSGQTDAAIALTQKLTTHPQPKVQQWAQKTLAQWEQLRHQPSPSATKAPPTDLSGFRPLEDAASPAKDSSPPPAEHSSGQAQNDLSGFQPLEDAAESSEAQTRRQTDAVGPSAQTPSETTKRPSTEIAAEASSPPLGSLPNHPERLETTPGPATIAPEASLFHYEHLNRVPLSTDEADSPLADDAFPRDEAIADHDEGATAELLQFSYAGRLPKLRALPKSGQDNLAVWAIMGLSAIALFWLLRTLIQWLLAQIARFLAIFDNWVDFPLNWRYQEHTFLSLLIVVGLLLASPWLLDQLLSYTHGLKPLSIQKLQKTHPESCGLLRRVTQRRHWLLPLLRELPTDAPLIFSYGWLPRYGRIVVSRGLLTQLDDQELATLIGYELTHFTRWTLPYMSLVALLLQALYQGYWQAAQWGDRRSDRWLKVLAAAVSTFCYTGYWVLRKVHLPLSRSRVRGGDRQAVEWTGNPNALTRALIKLENGLAKAIIHRGYTPALVESTDLLTPVGVEAAITPGSIFPDTTFLEILNWDIQNPYRRWLSINSSHPRLGERLKRLTGYALRWQLTPEIPFPSSIIHHHGQQTAISFWDRWRLFAQQISPYVGPLLGVIVAMVLWFLGGIFEPLGLRRVAWVYGDRSVLWGSLFLGLGMGIMVRINPYFPDITPKNRQKNALFPELISDPNALPTDSLPVRLEGTLLGRQGMANWLCQDFILKTPSGLLKLHFLSVLGALGNLFIHPDHPTKWVGRSLEVQGWLRRGAIVWLDVDTFLQSGKLVTRANHPMWSVFLSLVFCGLGLLLLIRG